MNPLPYLPASVYAKLDQLEMERIASACDQEWRLPYAPNFPGDRAKRRERVVDPCSSHSAK